ncbi:C2 family cysteine protease [Psychromicrobium xiongbiense]|uniref:C2 family cysteine protease n=1 Tax=Psychromicrobium xiongbiense TaxID=3051184 RepID=UPI002556F598|nr:C2 family cysteine protease [Psychromicrobium sp. YIM S02556]
MSEFLGASPEQLRALAVDVLAARSQIDTAAQLLDGSVGTAKWYGSDASTFRQQWSVRHRPTLSSVAGSLDALAETLRRNALEQEQASAVEGGGGSVSVRTITGSPSAPGGPGPLPDSDDALGPRNIHQGQLSDCWFLSGVGVVGMKDPQFLRNHIRWDEASGKYIVTFYEWDGVGPWATAKPVEVSVEPVAVDQGVRGPDGQTNLYSVWENAARTHMKNMGLNLDQGNANWTGLEMVTGQHAQTTLTAFESLSDIRSSLDNGALMTASTKQFQILGAEKSSVVPSHVYMVDGVVERPDPANPSGPPVQMIHVINPWGETLVDNGVSKSADLYLTEAEFRNYFNFTSSVELPKDR